MPALYALHRTGALNKETQIVGFSRRDWSDDDLREEMKGALQEYGSDNFDEEKLGRTRAALLCSCRARTPRSKPSRSWGST